MILVISEAGVDVVVAEGKFGDLALHNVNKYNMMAVRLMSKWDVRRLARTTAQPKILLTSEEPGMADSVYVDKLGDAEIMEFRENNVSTDVILGATTDNMDDIERAVDDCVNVFEGRSIKVCT